ncbi:hypothetical protein HDU99_007084, partial [Rhizoclosmatium hyalinum]
DLKANFPGPLPTMWPPALEDLTLSSSMLTGEFPTFNQTTALLYLSISHTQLSGPLPVLPTTLTSLTLISNPLIDAISVLPPALHVLTFTGTGRCTLPPLTDLEELAKIYIDNCNFTVFPELPNSLTVFTVGTTMFPASLPKLPDSLKKLELYRTIQTGSLPNLPPSLERLKLLKIEIAGFLPPLEVLSKLRAISVFDTNMSGPVPNLPSSLTTLDLYGNNFNGSIPSLPQGLQVFNLGGNSFSGEIPTLPQTLTYIDLSNNHLSGFIPSSISNFKNVYLDANCFTNAVDFNVVNVCSSEISQDGFSIAALSDIEYVDKAISYKDTLTDPCSSLCYDKIPSYSDVASFNTICLEIGANPNNVYFFSVIQKVDIYIKVLKTLCQQFLQPVPFIEVENNTVTFSSSNHYSELFGFQAFVSTANGTFVAGTKFDLGTPQNVSTNVSRKRDSLEDQTISIPCGLKANVLHMRYVVDDSVIALSDPNKLGHVKQIDLDLTASESGSECQSQPVPVVTTAENLPIKTSAVAVPVVTTAVVLPPVTTAIIVPQVVTSAELVPPTTIAIVSPIIKPPVVTTTVALPGATGANVPQVDLTTAVLPPATSVNIPPLVATTAIVSDANNSGTGGPNGTGSSGNQGGVAVDNTGNNGGSNGSTSSATTGSDNASENSTGNSAGNTFGNTAGNTAGNAAGNSAGNTAGNAAGNSAGNSAGTNSNDGNANTVAVISNSGDASKPVQPVTPATVDFNSITKHWFIANAAELQNSLVSVDKDVVPGAPLVTVAAPPFPKATGGMNKIVLSVDSYSFKFASSSGQVQTYNEASSPGSRTVSTAQGPTATIVLTLPDSVNTVLYGFQLNDASDNFIISVFKADDSRTPLAKISYSVQTQGAKRDGGKITVVMGVAKVRTAVTASAVTVVAPAKTFGSVDAQVLITSGAVFMSLQMAIPLLWLIL